MPHRLPSPPDPVELLLRRIAQRALAGSLLTGALATTSGCMAEARAPAFAEDEDAPVTREDAPATPAPDPGAPVGAPDAGDAGAGMPRDAGAVVPLDAGAVVPLDAGAFAALTCGPSGYPDTAPGLTLAGAYDSVAVRQVRGGPFAVGADAGADAWTVRPGVVTVSSTGTPCKSAQAPACAERARAHPVAFAPSYCVDMCVEWSLVTTRGDEVRRWTSKEALALLGSIDTRDEALLLVSFAGYNLRCDDPKLGGVRAVPGGFEVLATRITQDCAPVVNTAFRLRIGSDGRLTVLEQREIARQENACVGRMAAHVALRDEAPQGALGAYLARSAQLEAASVHAFAQLARELEAHGAPADLVARAREAEADEVRHADQVSRLARARGGVPRTPEVLPQPVRSLEAIAVENAVEGCVRETYGALVGAHQGARACDLGLRKAMAEIAADEARHAALSHAVHTWLVARLDAAARGRVLAAQIKAIGALSCEARREPEAALAGPLGLPSAATAQAMLDQLARELWLPSLAAA